MLEQQLRQLAADAPDVDPATSLADVVRRGRVRLVASRLLGGFAAAAVVAAGVVTVPLMLDSPVPTPEVLDADPVEDAVRQGGSDIGDGGADTPEPPSVEDADPAPLAVVFDVEIAILHPDPGYETDAAEVVVEGVVERGAEVWVSGVPAAVDGETFRAVVPLEPGEQELRAFARIGEDRVGVHEVLVIRRVEPDGSAEQAPAEDGGGADKPKPDPEPDEKPEPADVALTAVQARDHVEGDPPVGVYEGTGPAGYWVKVWSEYGWAKQQIGESGEWRVEVAFHDAPYGTRTWRVEAWLLDTEEKRDFEFTGTRPEGEAGTEFSAVQAKDHVEGDPPWAVYEGTGPAGHWVKAESEYGWAKTQIGPSGEWRLEVEFHDAPYGTHTWPVVVWLLETEHERAFQLTATRPEPEASTFSAHQVRGESDASPPTDAFWGTAHPGTKVIVESEYGSGRTVALENGEWELEVAFPEAPVGEPFPVEVHSLHSGESIWFDFERVG